MGVIAVETRTVELAIPADPANPESEAKVGPCKIQNLLSRGASPQFICPSRRLAFLSLPRIKIPHRFVVFSKRATSVKWAHPSAMCRVRIFALHPIGALIEDDPFCLP